MAGSVSLVGDFGAGRTHAVRYRPKDVLSGQPRRPHYSGKTAVRVRLKTVAVDAALREA
jgi:hypothetical protein